MHLVLCRTPSPSWPPFPKDMLVIADLYTSIQVDLGQLFSYLRPKDQVRPWLPLAPRQDHPKEAAFLPLPPFRANPFYRPTAASWPPTDSSRGKKKTQ